MIWWSNWSLWCRFPKHMCDVVPEVTANRPLTGGQSCLFATSYNRNCLTSSDICRSRPLFGTRHRLWNTVYTSNWNFDAPMIAAMHWSQPHRKCTMEMSDWRRIYGFLDRCLCFLMILMFIVWYGMYVNIQICPSQESEIALDSTSFFVSSHGVRKPVPLGQHSH